MIVVVCIQITMVRGRRWHISKLNDSLLLIVVCYWIIMNERVCRTKHTYKGRNKKVLSRKKNIQELVCCFYMRQILLLQNHISITNDEVARAKVLRKRMFKVEDCFWPMSELEDKFLQTQEDECMSYFWKINILLS